MGGGRKRRRQQRDCSDAPPTMHPRNRYASSAPDFAALAALYPSFAPFVSVSASAGGGRASVDFTDFAATRELTRVLLLHDHGVNWYAGPTPPLNPYARASAAAPVSAASVRFHGTG
jgi:23S rRNA (adenine1618-N6)-methyltransferase